jgi:predicted NBD/HSP70 family sugar kinase
VTVPGARHHGDAQAVDQLSVRRHNLSVVLRHLRAAGPRSRARIAAETGLNKATVSSLVAELAERGLVRDGEAERGAVGRPGQSVVLDGRGVCGIGVEVNVDYVAVLAMDLTGEVLLERREPVDAAHLDPGVVLDALARLAAEAMDAVSARGAQPVGITLAVPGLVEARTGNVSVAPNLGWRDVPAIEGMAERLGRPPYPLAVDNEANLAALAEVSWGSAAGTADLLLLTGEVGVGGGVVSGGRLVRGGLGFSGEVGPGAGRPVSASRRCCATRRIPTTRCATRPWTSTAGSPSCAGAPSSATPARWAPSNAPAAGWASARRSSSTSSTPRCSCSAATSPHWADG